MKKMALLAAAFALGGAAIAQDATGAQPDPPAQPDASLPEAQTETASPDMQQTPPAPPSGPTTVSPGNTNPGTDQSGNTVISDPAQAPPGFNQPPAPGGTGVSPGARPTPRPSTENYPACSRTVTDNCVQREGRARRGRR